jgi:ribonucleoside-diphosphate reductase alpha chain
MRIPTGDVQRKALNLHNAINITDEFMEAVSRGDTFSLRDPKDGSVKDTLDARKLWERIIETRFRTGEPYMHFIDTANRDLPQSLKDLGLKIHGSNLCQEIELPTSEERTAVCCLSSLNLEYYEEWKDTTIVADLIRMLDNVLEYFIENAPDTIPKAKFSAARERSIGLGAMGFHSLLQKHGVAWESETAKEMNATVFSQIKSQALAETELLATERGEYLDGVGTGRRHSHLLAVAPNASSGVILSTSPSIEPMKANAYTHRTRSGSFLVKNHYLEDLLIAKNENTDANWTSIITKKGSVQHLPFLTEGEKAIFKTADELDQNWVIRHAADRQTYICQGQSVNLFFPAGAPKSYVSQVHLRAWKSGLKGLYYLRTEAAHRAENVSEKIERVVLAGDTRSIVYSKKDCPFCFMAMEELKLHGIPFDTIDLASTGKSAAEVTGRKDVKSVPQIYIAGEYIGGYNELTEFLNKKVEQPSDDECQACSG